VLIVVNVGIVVHVIVIVVVGISITVSFVIGRLVVLLISFLHTLVASKVAH